MSFRPATATAGFVGSLRWAWAAEAQRGAARGGDRLFVAADDARAYFLLADVSGNGPAAAGAADALGLFASALPPPPLSPGRVLELLHTYLCQHWARTSGTDDFWFVDAVAVHFDLAAGTVEASAGGAPNVWAAGPQGRAAWNLPSGGFLGIPNLDAVFVSDGRPLPPGSSLLVTTDGVPDARGPSGRFGGAGVARVFDTLPAGGEPRAAVEAVFAAVRTFAAGSWPASDATALCFSW